MVLSPDGGALEAEGVLNPAIARDRRGVLLMYPRMVAAGNVSRIGIARGAERERSAPVFERLGIVLEAREPYELRRGAHGCEDPRITFMPELDIYVMAYTAFGEDGPRIALAVSEDAYTWTRLGTVSFAGELDRRDNKDAAMFPEPVLSPSGERSFAFYHRPMHPGSVNGQTPIPQMLALAPERRESICIAYAPVSAVKRDLKALLHPTESVGALPVDGAWGWLKNGAGTPPLLTEDGWLSFFHGVDEVERNGVPALYYQAGIVVHDRERPDRLLYRSPRPVLAPLTRDERYGIVDEVVFPTGVDRRPGGGVDVYYGAADAKISLARFPL